jgi:hypothetical protein
MSSIRQRVERLEQACGLGDDDQPTPLGLDGQTIMVTPRELDEFLKEINGSRVLPGILDTINGDPVCTT